MSKKKLIASAAAVLTAMTMMFPSVMSVSAVQIGTESNTVTEEPVQTDDPSTDTTIDTEPSETHSSKQTKTPTQTKSTTKSTTDTEEPEQTTEDTETTTKKKKKKTTTTTTTETETTTTSEEEDKNSYYSANIDLSHAGISEDGELNVKLRIDSDSRIAKATIFLDFDKDILKYVSSKINDDEIGGISSDSCDDGRYKFEYSNSSGTEFDGAFVTVTFELKKTTADQTAVMAVIDTLRDEEDNDISNRTVSNAIVTIPEMDNDDDSSKDSMADSNQRSYQPLSLSLSDKEISLESLGINEYKSVQTDDESIASVENGKIILHQAGECKMTVTYKDGSKGYFSLNVKAPETVASDESESSSEAAGSTLGGDSSSNNKTLKITVVILIVCVALILLIVEYFVLVVRRRKKAEQNRRSSGRRHNEEYSSDYDDDEEYVSRDYQTRRLNVPAEQINEGDDDTDTDTDYQYPTARRTKVNDFEDFLSGDSNDDIKFTGTINKVRDKARPDIEDFTLSQNGVNKG